jgi:RNA polymerase sigma-70 factor (ECF subfamily)
MGSALAFSFAALDDAHMLGMMGRHVAKGRGGVPNETLVVEPETGSARMSELLAAVAQASDRQAFAQLFQYYAPRLKTYMRKLGTEDSQAEELAQEAMLTVWRKAAFFDPNRANAGTWIFAIARNLRIDLLRKEKRPEIDLDDPDLVPDPAPRADDVMAMDQSERRVRAAVSGLSAEQTEVVTLSFYEDTPHAEIAARLKIPLGTVKSRLRLAMKRIRSELGGQEP